MEKNTIEKLINKEEQNKPSWLKELKQIAPHLFKDNEFDKDTFLYELEKDKEEKHKENTTNQIKSNEKYGFTWVGKREANDHSILDSINTLSPLRNKSLNYDTSKNIIIEGDNLEVLKILKKSYANKVDVIYIDPPYNTGNDFVYKDKFKISKEAYLEKVENFSNNKNDSESALYHTSWLNMIYPRLKVSRELLKDDGIIFISIDDNEQARLKLLCDEIFGEHNFISQLIWQKTTGANDSLFLKETTEYILFYAKNRDKFSINKKNLDVENDKRYKFEDEYVSRRGKYRLVNLDNASHSYSKGLDYQITISGVEYYPGRNKELWENRQKGNHTSKDWTWMWSKEKVEWGLKSGYIVADGKGIKCKVYQYVDNNDNLIKRTGSFLNIILVNEISNLQGTSEQKELFGKKVFDHPKPSELIKYLINLHPNKDASVLDFFAGSGTTGHAVMSLNKDDNGNRNYIMIQIPEKIENSEFNTIADITRERIQKSIELFNYKNEGFKYFELNSSNLTELDNSEDQETLFTEIIKRDRTTEQLLTELTLMTGFDLNTKFTRVETDHVAYYIDETQSNMYFLDKTVYDRYLIDEIKKIWDSKKGLGVLNIIVRSDCFSTNDIKMGIIKYINELKKTGNIGIKEI